MSVQPFLGRIALFLLAVSTSLAATVNVNFSKLTGVTGGSPQGTAVYVADLSTISFDILSLTINDNSSGLGGATGQFSGFDLDAIKFSHTLVGDAGSVNALPGLNVFNFGPSNIMMTPGTQRPPADPALFGTAGGSLNNGVATLGDFDANSTTGVGAFGFVSLGDGGSIAFNLTSPVSPMGGLFLYIGEVGDNGEIAAGTITISDTAVPEPATLLPLAVGLGLLGALRKKRRSAQR